MNKLTRYPQVFKQNEVKNKLFCGKLLYFVKEKYRIKLNKKSK